MEFKVFLLIYGFFYGYNYKPYLDSTRNGPLHLRAQYLYSLLYYLHMDFKLFGNLDCNLYEYTWLKNGPHSRRLEQDLNRIDVEIDQIAAFYRDEYKNEKLKYLGIIEELDILKSIFFSDEIIEFLKKAKHSKEEWVRVLAIMAFIKNNLISDGGFLGIEKELKHKGILWSGDNKLNYKAWELLQEAEII